MQELTMSRGFQSSVSPYLNFGIGNDEIIKSIKVVWSNGNSEELKDLKINSIIEFDITNSKPESKIETRESNLYFENVDIVEHKHNENEYNDYIKEVLLPHENSRLGPGIAIGDINGDKIDDFVVGGAKDQPTAFYIQKSDGSFYSKSFVFSKEHAKKQLTENLQKTQLDYNKAINDLKNSKEAQMSLADELQLAQAKLTNGELSEQKEKTLRAEIAHLQKHLPCHTVR